MKLSTEQKILASLFGIQFLASFLKEKNRLKEENKLSSSQKEFIVKEIMNSSIYKTLTNEGKSAKDIIKILEINNMNSERFYLLTGKHWPAK